MGKSNSQIVGSFVCHLGMRLFGSVEMIEFDLFNFIRFIFE